MAGRFIPIGMLVGHEKIAEIEVKVGLIGQDIGERSLIHGRAGVFIQMDICREGEAKSATRWSSGVEGIVLTSGKRSASGRA